MRSKKDNPGFDWRTKIGKELAKGIDYPLVNGSGFVWLKEGPAR